MSRSELMHCFLEKHCVALYHKRALPNRETLALHRVESRLSHGVQERSDIASAQPPIVTRGNIDGDNAWRFVLGVSWDE
jgi:hypothetical protein